MWIFGSDFFLSIVEPMPGGVDPKKYLVVRARLSGDINRIFPGVKVTRNKNRDYRFRAIVERERVADVLANEARNISYDNFKNSVREDKRHVAYLHVWQIMADLQNRRTETWPTKIAAPIAPKAEFTPNLSRKEKRRLKSSVKGLGLLPIA